ncbi:MAG: hypothetical protein WD534_13000 [Phycisphaeraceae bacterium]
MAQLDVIWSQVDDLLGGVALATPERAGEETFPLRLPPDTQWIIVAATDPDASELVLPPGLQLGWDAPDRRLYEPSESDEALVRMTDRGPSLVALPRPEGEQWLLRLAWEAQTRAIVSTTMIRAPLLAAAGTALTRTRLRCRTCKASVHALATALAASLVAGASLAGLGAVVAALLSISIPAAIKFIQTLTGMTVDQIADALCAKVSLCP